MTDGTETKLSPAWRQAEKDLLNNGLTYGSIIEQEWLDCAFGIQPPQTISQYQRNELIRLRQMQDLAASLLENHKMLLTPVRGIGHTVAHPAQQTQLALNKRGKEVRAALAKMARELSHINGNLLTDAQRTENTDALAKLGQLRSITRKKLRYSSED